MSMSKKNPPALSFGRRVNAHAPRTAAGGDYATEYGRVKAKAQEKFEWEEPAAHAINSRIPYRLQRDPLMYTKEALRRREALKRHATIQGQIRSIWELVRKDRDGRLGVDGYALLFMRICRMLNPDLSEVKARKLIAADFKRDARGQNSLSYELFEESLFELADHWCTGIDGAEYAEFLDKLFCRMVVAKDAADVVVSSPKQLERARAKRFVRRTSHRLGGGGGGHDDDDDDDGVVEEKQQQQQQEEEEEEEDNDDIVSDVAAAGAGTEYELAPLEETVQFTESDVHRTGSTGR